MRFGIPFLAAGASLLYWALRLGHFGLLLLWPGLSIAALGLGYLGLDYLGLGGRMLGKRPDGTMAPVSVLFFLPYLLLTWLTWLAVRRLTRENCWDEVRPGLVLGRRPLGSEIPEQVSLIVDLAAEFPEAARVREGRSYLSVPILDGAPASELTLQELVGRIAEWPGTVYIHCAQGHGRSAMVAAAVLIATGQATTVDDSLAALRRARPRVRLERSQIRALHKFLAHQQAKADSNVDPA